MLSYNTILVWTKDKSQLIAFYKIVQGKRLIAIIPCGIDFVFRKKQYNTMKLVSLLLDQRKNKSQNEKDIMTRLPIKVDDWYDMNNGGGFNKKLFVALSKSN